MKRTNILIVLIILAFSFFGCSAPSTFMRTMEPTWAQVEIRENVTYDQAWADIIDLLIRRFDIEVAQKENGYIRTGWLYTWTGKYTESYRVRVTVKFDIDNHTVEVKSEAYYKGHVGFDTRLLQTMKTDIMGTIGRVTR